MACPVSKSSLNILLLSSELKVITAICIKIEMIARISMKLNIALALNWFMDKVIILIKLLMIVKTPTQIIHIGPYERRGW